MSIFVNSKYNGLALSILFYSSISTFIHPDTDDYENVKSSYKNTIDVIDQYEKESYLEDNQYVKPRNNNSNTHKNNAQPPVVIINNTAPQPSYQNTIPQPALNNGYTNNNANNADNTSSYTPFEKNNKKDKKNTNDNNDETDQPNDYVFSNYRWDVPYPKSWKSFTWDWIGMPAIMLAVKLKDMYDKYENHTNTEQKTIFSFFRDEVFSKEGLAPLTLLGRIVTSFSWERKKVVCKHLAIGLSMNHLIFPGLLLEINTGYYHDSVFGVAFRFGLDEPIKLSLHLKLGGFYLKLNTLRISTVDVIYMLYNNGLKKSTNNARTPIWQMFERIQGYINKYYYWDINNPLAEKLNMKDSSIFSMLLGGISLGIGGISENE